MSELNRGYGRNGCKDKKGRFDINEMYKQIYLMQAKDGVTQKVIAHMFDITATRVGQIKKQYINKLKDK